MVVWRLGIQILSRGQPEYLVNNLPKYQGSSFLDENKLINKHFTKKLTRYMDY